MLNYYITSTQQFQYLCPNIIFACIHIVYANHQSHAKRLAPPATFPYPDHMSDKCDIKKTLNAVRLTESVKGAG